MGQFSSFCDLYLPILLQLDESFLHFCMKFCWYFIWFILFLVWQGSFKIGAPQRGSEAPSSRPIFLFNIITIPGGDLYLSMQNRGMRKQSSKYYLKPPKMLRDSPKEIIIQVLKQISLWLCNSHNYRPPQVLINSRRLNFLWSRLRANMPQQITSDYFFITAHFAFIETRFKLYVLIREIEDFVRT